MTTQTSPSTKFRVCIVGGGVAAIEAALALSELAPEQTDVTLIAPNEQFVYRPMSVTEPFASGGARHYPLAPIVADAGATLLVDKLDWIEPKSNTVHTEAGETIEYDALMLTMGAHPNARYQHATTIDDRRLDDLLHGLVQDIEGGFIKSIAFVSPGRMPWPLPLYELALMTAGRAYDMQVDLAITLITPEDAPLAIFGQTASNAVAEVLTRAGIETIASAYAEVPEHGKLVINPGDRRLRFDRVVALPELTGPGVRGVPLGENGFLRVDPHGRLRDSVGPIFAAGDAIDFPIKQGGLGCQQADAAAESIAALAGAQITPEPFRPVIRAKLLTDGDPLYLTAKISGGAGFSSEVSSTPTWSPPSKIAARYLAPYLDALDKSTGESHNLAVDAVPTSI